MKQGRFYRYNKALGVESHLHIPYILHTVSLFNNNTTSHDSWSSYDQTCMVLFYWDSNFWMTVSNEQAVLKQLNNSVVTDIKIYWQAAQRTIILATVKSEKENNCLQDNKGKTKLVLKIQSQLSYSIERMHLSNGWCALS